MCEQHDYRHSAVHKERISTIIRTQIKRPSKSCITQEHHSWKRHSTPPPPPLLLRSDSTLCLYSGFFSNTLPTHTIISRPPPQLFTHFPFFHPAPRNPQPPAFIVPRQFSRGPFPRVSSNISVISSALFFSNSVMPILRHQRKGMVQHDRSAHWLWLTIWWNFCAA